MVFPSVVVQVVRAMGAAVSWFFTLFASLPGGYQFVISFVMLSLIFRFLLLPLIGAQISKSASDTVRQSSHRLHEEDR